MGLKVQGIISAKEMLLNLDTTGRRRVLKKLYEEAYALRDLARKFAPREFRGLEEAIKVRPEQGESARDELGRFAKKEIEVYVDGDMPALDPKRPNHKVGEYAYEIHEHLFPYGAWNLGKESIEKQEGQSEQVGGGYLERAALAIEQKIDQVLLDILRDL